MIFTSKRQKSVYIIVLTESTFDKYQQNYYLQVCCYFTSCCVLFIYKCIDKLVFFSKNKLCLCWFFSYFIFESLKSFAKLKKSQYYFITDRKQKKIELSKIISVAVPISTLACTFLRKTMAFYPGRFWEKF